MLDEYYDKTQSSSPQSSRQGAEGSDKGGDSSTVTDNNIDKILNEAASSEMRIRLNLTSAQQTTGTPTRDKKSRPVARRRWTNLP